MQQASSEWQLFSQVFHSTILRAGVCWQTNFNVSRWTLEPSKQTVDGGWQQAQFWHNPFSRQGYWQSGSRIKAPKRPPTPIKKKPKSHPVDSWLVRCARHRPRLLPRRCGKARKRSESWTIQQKYALTKARADERSILLSMTASKRHDTTMRKGWEKWLTEVKTRALD